MATQRQETSAFMPMTEEQQLFQLLCRLAHDIATRWKQTLFCPLPPPDFVVLCMRVAL